MGATTDIDYALKISDTSFYTVAKAPINQAILRRMDVSDPSAPSLTWGKYMNCIDANSWGVGISFALLNSNETEIYSFTATGTGLNSNIAFARLDVTDGSLLGSVFATSINCTEAKSSRFNGNKVYSIIECESGTKFLIYDSSSHSFTKVYDVSGGDTLYSFVIDYTGNMWVTFQLTL